MLPENHSLYDAETFLAFLFQSATEDSWIEFRAIWNHASLNGGCNDPGEHKRAVVEACTIKTLEDSFDYTISNWILRLNKLGYDIYFGVCPRFTMPRTPKNAVRAASNNEVSHAVCAWVDHDNPMWRDILKHENVKSTFVVSTGNGCHIYYRYKEIVPIKQATTDSEKLSKMLAGDKCYDAARILRVPGTRNWKNHDAVLKCEIFTFDPDFIFDGPPNEAVIQDGKPGNVFGLSMDLRNVILHGYAAAQGAYIAQGKGDKDAGRSEIDFRVAKDLYKFGWEDHHIKDVFLNPQYGISEKTLEEAKRGNSENYLQRTLEAGKEKAEKESIAFPEVGEVLTLETAAELNKAPMPSFAVDALLPNYGLMIMSGPAKSGKSLSTIDLIGLLAGAKGKYMERFAINKPGPVLYCQDEIPKAFLKQRFKNIINSRGNDWMKLPHPIMFYNAAFDIGNPRHMMAVERGLKEMNAEYLVIDPISDYHMLNENRAADMITVFNSIDRIRKSLGLRGVILVHHHGKPPSDGDSKEGIFAPRGSSVIGAKGDGHVIMRSKVSQITAKEFVEISFKLRAAKAPPPLTMTLDEESLRFEDYNEGTDQLLVTLKTIEKHAGDKDKVLVELRAAGFTKQDAERYYAKGQKEINDLNKKMDGPPSAEEKHAAPHPESNDLGN